MTKHITIGLVLPDVLGSNGDNGNALVLRQRARWRGFSADIQMIKYGDDIPQNLSIYTIGGGEDPAQALAADYLNQDKGLTQAAYAGAPIFASGAGFQILGESFVVGHRVIDGLGLIDATTSPMPERATGELTSTPTGSGITAGLDQPLSGFENHIGGTILGPGATPLATLDRGTGNIDAPYADDLGSKAAQRHAEGAIQGSVVATYMHGPALARNPQLADLLLSRALGLSLEELEPLEMGIIDTLRMERMA